MGLARTTDSQQTYRRPPGTVRHAGPRDRVLVPERTGHLQLAQRSGDEFRPGGSRPICYHHSAHFDERRGAGIAHQGNLRDWVPGPGQELREGTAIHLAFENAPVPSARSVLTNSLMYRIRGWAARNRPSICDPQRPVPTRNTALAFVTSGSRSASGRSAGDACWHCDSLGFPRRDRRSRPTAELSREALASGSVGRRSVLGRPSPAHRRP